MVNILNTLDTKYIKECLHLARSGYGQVNPNPMVGAVIVKDGVVIAEGVHRRFGGDHAEVDALKKAGSGANGATLYVNLEPCNHYGKTPPCTSAIVNAGIKRVVYAAEDPNPGITGGGKQALQKCGVEVQSGVLHDEAVELNEHYYFSMRSKLPFVILKAAATLDGYIADSRSNSKWITGEFARAYVQNIRRGVDAVLVGANTILHDNPRLTVHDRMERQPYRTILDGPLLTPVSSRVYTDEFRNRTIVVCTKNNRNKKKIERLEKKGVTVVSYTGTNKIIPLRRILRDLHKGGVLSILVEGGSTVFRQFIESKLYARALFFIAPKIIGGGVPVVNGINRSMRNAYALDNVTSEMIGDDVLIQGDTELYGKYVR